MDPEAATHVVPIRKHESYPSHLPRTRYGECAVWASSAPHLVRTHLDPLLYGPYEYMHRALRGRGLVHFVDNMLCHRVLIDHGCPRYVRIGLYDGRPVPPLLIRGSVSFADLGTFASQRNLHRPRVLIDPDYPFFFGRSVRPPGPHLAPRLKPRIPRRTGPQEPRIFPGAVPPQFG